MKKTTFILLFYLPLLSGCKDNMSDIESPHIAGKHIDIKGIKSFLPKELKEQKKCYYTDSTNVKKELNIRYREQLDTRELNGEQYTSDKFDITFYDNTDPLFQIVLLGSANYNTDYSIIRGLTVMLMPANPNGTILSTIRFDENGEPKSNTSGFLPSVSLNNRTFNNCFLLTGTNPNAYSEIYINSEIGVVAFRDANNTLFVFDKYME